MNAETSPSARAFTLIELMVVIAVIGLLISIALVVGKSVRTGGQARQTEDTIRVLDMSLVAYEKATNELPPAIFTITDSGPGTNSRNNQFQFAFIDGRDFSKNTGSDFDKSVPAVNTIARYSALCQSVPEADSAIKNLNSKLVRRVILDTTGPKPSAAMVTPPAAVEVLDGFGNPIRFVHPAFDGGYGDAYVPKLYTRDPTAEISETRGTGTLKAKYRRSAQPFDPKVVTTGSPIGDADEGICPSRRPYFYSSGPDGNPGTRSNNVYTTAPTFPTETAALK